MPNLAKQRLQPACGSASSTMVTLQMRPTPYSFAPIGALLTKPIFCPWSFNSIRRVLGKNPFCTMLGSCFYFSLQWLPLFHLCPTCIGLCLSPRCIVFVPEAMDLVVQVLNNFGPPLLLVWNFQILVLRKLELALNFLRLMCRILQLSFSSNIPRFHQDPWVVFKNIVWSFQMLFFKSEFAFLRLMDILGLSF